MLVERGVAVLVGGERPRGAAGQTSASGHRIRDGDGSVDVVAGHRGSTYTTEVTRHGRTALTIGAVLPDGTEVRSVRVDGRTVDARLVDTARGLEVRVPLGAGSGTDELVVRTR